jgi:TolA-binding protein
MDVFGGALETAKIVPRDEWIRYPYARSQNKESFSQALFRLLGIPEVANEVSGNITIHQILRLLYADQLSPVESLFKFDTVFDPPILREAIARLLCGAYESTLYENELRIRALQREFDTISGELRSLLAVIGRDDHGLTLEWIDGQRAVLEEERSTLQTKIEEAERQVFTSTADDELTLKAQEDAYDEVQRLQSELGTAWQERNALALDIADSAAFITSLKNKIDALNDSSSVAKHIGEVQFQACPACFAPLEDENESPPQICHLCKTPFSSDRFGSRIVALINDTALQLRQSEILQQRRHEKVKVLDADVHRLKEEWRRSSRRLEELQRLPSSEARDRLRTLHRQSGYLERQIENLEERARIIEQIDQLSRDKAEANGAITSLKNQNEALRASQQQRLSRAYTSIADEIRILLRHDLRREEAFEDPKSIEFDFAANRISVDGQTYFSASSRAILKSSFFLGFLDAATKHQFFRHPRFCIIDTVEDKGMEPQRSHNFQMQITHVSEMSTVDHQIIYATAMIAPDLDDARYTVGKFSTRDDPTIAIRR